MNKMKEYEPLAADIWALGIILFNIKPRLVKPLECLAGCWLDELPAVLWSLRTTPNK